VKLHYEDICQSSKNGNVALTYKVRFSAPKVRSTSDRKNCFVLHAKVVDENGCTFPSAYYFR
jgi:hypothetical protein